MKTAQEKKTSSRVVTSCNSPCRDGFVFWVVSVRGVSVRVVTVRVVTVRVVSVLSC